MVVENLILSLLFVLFFCVVLFAVVECILGSASLVWMSSTTSLFFFSPSQCLLRAYGADKYNEWTGGEHSKGFWQKERGSLCATYQRVYWLPSAVFLFRCQRLSLRRLLLSTSLFSVVLSIKKKKKSTCLFIYVFVYFVRVGCVLLYRYVSVFRLLSFFFFVVQLKKKEKSETRHAQWAVY